ncbi:hypothetical protein EVAR_28724_1 [Eumeta japonica]|uniref:Uncharacterized protein n=1 Tax=Eumeta variegata TaxID=151549 RepID=A0A4C1V439_EUMVA|nr:hypothetical protein EVAR_28724_1 [Eumeta japonica]
MLERNDESEILECHETRASCALLQRREVGHLNSRSRLTSLSRSSLARTADEYRLVVANSMFKEGIEAASRAEPEAKAFLDSDKISCQSADLTAAERRVDGRAARAEKVVSRQTTCIR